MLSNQGSFEAFGQPKNEINFGTINDSPADMATGRNDRRIHTLKTMSFDDSPHEVTENPNSPLVELNRSVSLHNSTESMLKYDPTNRQEPKFPF